MEWRLFESKRDVGTRQKWKNADLPIKMFHKVTREADTLFAIWVPTSHTELTKATEIITVLMLSKYEHILSENIRKFINTGILQNF